MKLTKMTALLLAGALVLSACSGTPSETTAAQTEGGAAEETTAAAGTGSYTAGTYTGEGQGYGGTVTVTITTDETSILDVTAEGSDETPNVGGAALEELASQVLSAQSAEIDGVSGATMTSNGVRQAAQAAIDAASGNASAGAGEKTAGRRAAGAGGAADVDRPADWKKPAKRRAQAAPALYMRKEGRNGYAASYRPK